MLARNSLEKGADDRILVHQVGLTLSAGVPTASKALASAASSLSLAWMYPLTGVY